MDFYKLVEKAKKPEKLTKEAMKLPKQWNAELPNLFYTLLM